MDNVDRFQLRAKFLAHTKPYDPPYPLSVYAWINGGAPGQVIISQADITIDTPVGPSTTLGSTWLGINSTEGKLITGLGELYFGPLESESVITDAHWHHVGFVFDITTMKRHLYIDGVEVAIDADYVAGLSCDAGLYIGAGQALNAATFFSGLIDDVRIYDVALSEEEIVELAR